MPQAPTKKPAAPNSIAPSGPTNPAATIYPPMSGKTAVNAPGDTSDPWRGGAVATPNGAVPTKGAVPVKVAKNLPGNQGTKNSHTKPDAIKPVGSDAALRKVGSVTSTTAMKKMPSSKVYPHLNNG